jgi:hypothetical protein
MFIIPIYLCRDLEMVLHPKKIGKERRKKGKKEGKEKRKDSRKVHDERHPERE